MSESSPNVIRITGARQNNLRDVSLKLPTEQLIAITGVSGSGKSSLALETLYAEGQRRYLETFSPYARQFLDRLDRPRVEEIEGVPPAIAIQQGNPIRSSRSTVGTMTEIADHLKLLYARRGVLHCRECGRQVQVDTPESVWGATSDISQGSRVLITFPLDPAGRGPEEVRLELLRQGFLRLWHRGAVYSLDENPMPAGEPLEVLMDRLIWDPGRRERILDSFEQALEHGRGRMCLILDGGERRFFSSERHCAFCDIYYPEPSSHLFSFNSPLGACETCRGFGRVIDVDLDLVIPDKGRSLAEGAIKPWGTDRLEYYDLMAFCKRRGIPVHVPFRKLSAEQQRAVIEESDDFYGIRGFFRWLETKTYKMHVRVFLSRYRAYLECPDCRGSRLNPEALLYRLDGVDIASLNRWPVTRTLDFMQALAAEFAEDAAASLVCKEILQRLVYLEEVGLGYLNLDRPSRSLSGGEVQRVHLTRALGSPLVNTLYVLDEPSVGLHARDNEKLVNILKKLTRQHNTVVVVEHDPEIVAASDYLVDLGPGAGEKGGQVVYAGPTAEAATASSSRTASYLSGQSLPPRIRARRTAEPDHWLYLKGIQAHNLRGLDIDIPLGMLVAVTGVSGSGKSTLVEEVLYRNWRRLRGLPVETPATCGEILGFEHLDEVKFMDQQAIGRTPRSNLLTYAGALTPIRKLFAGTRLARVRGYGPGHFSFNTPGGRCEACAGEGFEKVEMQFLADVYLPCPVCQGKRYREEILEVRYRQHSIGDVLNLTLNEAMELFSDQPRITAPLAPLGEVGLDYLRLGQPINTLSGGESQRLKLARSLHLSEKGRVLLILDEPTTGLHVDDVSLLIQTLHRLVAAGQSVLVVEHNLEVIRSADYVIDLGPEGGDEGGRLVVAGMPEQVARCPSSHTGRFLARMDERKRPPLSARRVLPDGSDKAVIKIRGAREHNLKDLSLDLPRDRMLVITGISGSGKSTLAFDILFAEGQRRYLDSLSTYARQYLPLLDRPQVDEISGVPPTVAIDQRSSLMTRRSTVATITEIYHYLRLLYSKAGMPFCPRCGEAISAMSPEEIAADLSRRFQGRPLILLAPKIMGRKGFHRQVLMEARARGYRRARIDGRVRSLDPLPELARFREHDVEIVVEQWAPLTEAENRLAEAVDRALATGEGMVTAWDGKSEERFYSKRLTCARCHQGIPTLDPRLFSFNSRHGACSRCEGLGSLDAGDGRVCPVCNGARLKEGALNVKIHGMSIWEVCRRSVAAARSLFGNWEFSGRQETIARPLLEEIGSRLQFLEQVGLGYLSLHRSADTLSGGEAQRIRLAAQMGSNLRGVCYILDEPTIGLHPRDNDLLLATLKQLRDRGNTIVVVEHDEETIRRADHLVDLGPGAGRQGGWMVASGTLDDLEHSPQSVTGRYLRNGNHRRLTSRERAARVEHWLGIAGARARNLKDLNVSVPLGALTCVTGVSGSGKSTLVKETLYRELKSRLGKTCGESGCLRGLTGWEYLDRVLEVDHSPIGRTPRSVPATYVGVFDEIRRLFAATPSARARGYRPGRFSFNMAAGQCPHCKGQGQVRVQMAFLPDIYVKCEQCGGSRFNSETLAVRYKGRNIAEVLAMTIDEAAEFFAPVARIGKPLRLLVDLGLGYLGLGQPSPSLSGGEAQRLKLVNELAGSHRASILYVLDEPTTGLHIADVERLVGVLQALVERGHTIVVIEHNMEVIKAADYIIDLGPGGGDQGGEVVATGPPRELVGQTDRSFTARYLRRYLNNA